MKNLFLASLLDSLGRCEHGQRAGVDMCFLCGERGQPVNQHLDQTIGYTVGCRPVTVRDLIDAYRELPR